MVAGLQAGQAETCAGDAVTPLVDVMVEAARWRQPVGLKLEDRNPSGSIKYRTARELVRYLQRCGRLPPGAAMVESSSGNLAVALAWLSGRYRYRFTAVTDPKTDPAVIARIRGLGADTLQVSEPDRAGGYLLSRLAMVRRLITEDPDRVWTNQYECLANPAAHYHHTAPEVHRQRPEVDAVFVAASTGGTLAGVGRYFHTAAPGVRVIGVDVRGSRVFGSPGGPRVLTGIGSSRPSSFLRCSDYDDLVIVSEPEAIAACHHLYQATGIGVGGSSGAVLAACARYLPAHPELRRPVCLCPDGQANYLSTIYDQGWLAAHARHLGDRPADSGQLRFTVTCCGP